MTRIRTAVASAMLVVGGALALAVPAHAAPIASSPPMSTQKVWVCKEVDAKINPDGSVTRFYSCSQRLT